MRKGMVGGYSVYMAAEDIKFLDDLIADELDNFFGFNLCIGCSVPRPFGGWNAIANKGQEAE